MEDASQLSDSCLIQFLIQKVIPHFDRITDVGRLHGGVASCFLRNLLNCLLCLSQNLCEAFLVEFRLTLFAFFLFMSFLSSLISLNTLTESLFEFEIFECVIFVTDN